MFWWQHTGPRGALLTCSEILKFRKKYLQIFTEIFASSSILYWWLNSRNYKPQVTTQHSTNEFQRIPRDKWGVNQPSLSIKSQLIIKSCWAGIIRRQSGTGGDLNARAHHSWPSSDCGRVRTEEGLRVRGEELPGPTLAGLICPVEDKLGGPKPFTTTSKAGFKVETHGGNSQF